MKRAMQQPFALFVVSISAALVALLLMAYGYEVFEPGSVVLFAIGLVSLKLARRRTYAH